MLGRLLASLAVGPGLHDVVGGTNGGAHKALLDRNIQPPGVCVGEASVQELAIALVQSVLIHLRGVLTVVHLVLHEVRPGT